MLPDTKALQKEVAADVGKVRTAFAQATAKVDGTPVEAELRALSANVDAWAKRGTDAAAKPAATPSPNGWPGWQTAGSTLLAGIDDIAKIGGTSTLDAIVATVKDTPAEVARTAKKAVQTVADGAHAAEHAALAVGAGVRGLAREALLYGAAALVLLVLLKRAV